MRLCIDDIGNRQPKRVNTPFIHGHRTKDIVIEARLELSDLLRRQSRVRLTPFERLIHIIGFEEDLRAFQKKTREFIPAKHRNQKGDEEK